ncbi:MAG TPA: (Fe-S)-binding protein [Elusimicrobiota bacterium]|nr:(Fe-S)-binding protein [Elusimicrobiota bacterium]
MAEPLGRLLTDLGERSTEDAAAQCSRCGYCEQACPTYVATGREAKSPRGRNQLVRMMLEGKLDDPEAAREALDTCLLCGACTTACYAKVAVPDIVLEGRRALRGRTPWPVRFANRLLIESPGTLAALLKLGALAKRLGLSRLARPFLRLAGYRALAAMDEHVEEVPLRHLDEELAPLRASGEGDAWNYFAPCGPRYLYPRVGIATWKALTKLRGPGRFLENPCCGLLANNYGDVEDARTLARKNIENAEAKGDGPVVGDCSSCVAHLKAYPQLFLMPSDADWRARAERFSARVRDAVEVLGEAAPGLPRSPEDGPVTYHDSCRAVNGQGLRGEPRRALKAAAGESFCEMAGADVCCGGAGAFAFVNEELSDEVLRRKVGSAAASHARVVVTSSTSCLIQLARGLRKYYPDARVLHLSEYVLGALENRNGT